MGTDSPDCSRSHVASLRRVSSIISSNRALDEMLGELVGLAVEATGSDACLVYLLEPEAGEIVLRASQLPHAAELGSLRMPVGEGVTGWVAEHKTVVSLPSNAPADARFRRFPTLVEDTYEAFLSVPLVSRGEVIGVINVHHKQPHEHTPEEVALLVFIGEQMGVAISRARLDEENARLQGELPGGKGANEPGVARHRDDTDRIMPGRGQLRDRFHLAATENINQGIQQCDYEPDMYLRMVSQYGGIEAARRLLAEPVSDDSLQLWARGRADLTIEAMARSEAWKELFSEDERLVAEQRCANWLLTPAANELVAQVLTSVINPLSPEPEDNIAWGE